MPNEITPPALAQIAERVRTRYARLKNDVHQTAFVIGGDLLKAKELLPHGEFMSWVEREFEFGRSTAQNYMNYALAYPKERLPTVGNLPVSVAFQLAAPSLPAEKRAEVLDRVDAGASPDDIDLRQIKREAAETAKEERRLAKLPPKKQRDRRRAAERRAAEREKQQAEAEEMRVVQDAAAAQAVAMIKEALGDRFPELLELVKKAGWRFRL